MKKDIYIYGAGYLGKHALDSIMQNYNSSINVLGFIDEYKTGEEHGLTIRHIDEADNDIAVVITIADEEIAKKVFFRLKEERFREIWWYNSFSMSHYADFFQEQCVSSRRWDYPTFNHVEMHIMDACNLNCKGCCHFSPLFDKKQPDFEDRMADVKALSQKGIFIENFYILGGEPFLNPEIDKYAVGIRELFPETKIRITTNGILIPKIGDEILRNICESGAFIEITDYPPTQRMHEAIDSRLSRYDVRYYYKKLNFNNRFSRPFSMSGRDSRLDHYCISDGCVNIYNGKISRCPQLMYLSRFNDAFNQSLPTDGIYDLDTDYNGEELVRIMSLQVSLCDYCIYDEIDWTVCGATPQIFDFATYE